MPSPVGVLDKLTPEQQATLLLSMDSGEPDKAVLRKVSAPPPDGSGIRTHVTSLRRFYARRQLDDRLADLELARAHASAKNGSEALFLNAAENILAETAFEFPTSSDFRPEHFRVVSNWLLKVRDRELRREQVETNRERLALLRKREKFLAAVREAHSRTSHQEQKIAEARLRFEDEGITAQSSDMPSSEPYVSR